MVALQAEAVRWVDDEFPGWVEVQFSDATGRRWSLVDKVPVFDAPEDLGPGSVYPLEVRVACVMIEAVTAEEGDVVTVSISLHGVTALSGEDEFNVRRNQLVP
ncbi:hypothetical protein ABT010_41590 [Streptomyces sp. NPDC002668]|uniref:hypothetical protein n=1 Tax=Streptomyces sp. NPDC002668 TaxID=3154422 RepID=UPI003317E423